MTDPTARPGNDDQGIEQATGEVVGTWRDAADGKEPTASTGDFERMREGFADAASRGDAEADDARDVPGGTGAEFAREPTREEQLGHNEPASTGDTAAETRTTSQAGPDA